MATVDEQRAERREELEAERAGQKRKTPPKHPEPTSFDAEPLTTPSGKRVTVTDQEFAVMLERAGGFRTRVAKQLGISASAVTHRIKRSKYLSDVCRTVEETVLDMAEAQLLKAAQNGEPWAITFILKCKGRKRGWIERQDIAFGGDADALPPPVVLSVHDAAYVEAERERQKREFADVVDAAMIELKPRGAAGVFDMGGGEDAAETPGSAETSGATAQPSDGGAGNGPSVAPTGDGKVAESPQTGAGAAVARPAERDASSQGGADGAPQRAVDAPVATAKPQPPSHIPGTPSEAAAMRKAEAERQRLAQGGDAKGGAGGRPKPRFFAVPSAFPRR